MACVEAVYHRLQQQWGGSGWSGLRLNCRRSRPLSAFPKAASGKKKIGFVGDRKAAVADRLPSAVLDRGVRATLAMRSRHKPAADRAPVGAACAAAARPLEDGRARRYLAVLCRYDAPADRTAERAATSAFCHDALLTVGAARVRGPQGCSAARREGIAAKAVALADLTIAAMDQQLAVLVLRDSACRLDRCSLSLVHRRRALVARSANRPAAFVRYHMLVLAHVRLPPSPRYWVSRLATPLPNPMIGAQGSRLSAATLADI